MFDTRNWIDGFEISDLSLALLTSTEFTQTKLTPTDITGSGVDLWENHDAFESDPALFNDRLEFEGLSLKKLKLLQSNEKEIDIDKLDSSWIHKVKQAYEANSIRDLSYKRTYDIKLLKSIEFLIDWKLINLFEKTREFENHSNIVNLFVPLVLSKLAKLIDRCVVLEMHLEKMQGNLKGHSAEERFFDYINSFSDKKKQLIFINEYPLLGKKALHILSQWSDFVMEFFERLSHDTYLLQNEFGNKKIALSNLTHVEGGFSDSHNGGRSVLILMFDNNFKLVYKPRSMSIDVHFFQLIDWVNQNNNDMKFKTVKILNCNEYGWSEFITNKVCDSNKKLQRYYERVGGLMAVLYALEATDMHYENIIALGEHPIIIDVETLFQGGVASDNADEVLDNYSVLSTGLLPIQILNGQVGNLDVSGIACSDKVTVEARDWSNSYTDEMKIVNKTITLDHTFSNLPIETLKKEHIVILVKSIKDGFSLIYKFLSEHKIQLLAQGGPISAFSGNSARYVLRNTSLYTEFLRDLSHPENLNSSISAEHRLDYLYTNQLNRKQIHKVIQHEKNALKSNDVPCFSIPLCGRQLQSVYGQDIDNYLSNTPYSSVKLRIENLGPNDFDKQHWIINSSLKTLATRYGLTKDELISSTSLSEAPMESVTNDGLIDKFIFNHLNLIHFSNKKEATWLGISLMQDNWTFDKVSNTLYEGQLGNTLFLACYASQYNDPIAQQLTDKSLAFILKGLNDKEVSIGAFDGLSGYLYVLSHAFALTKILPVNNDYLKCVNSIKPRLKSLIAQDKGLDIISGAAGCLLSCLSAYKAFDDIECLDLATLCGDHLLDTAQTETVGCSWLINGQEKALSGFSHGASGISYALTALYKITGNKSYFIAAKQGIAFENSLFSKKYGNWKDNRGFVGDSTAYSTSAWCHGGAGILFSRLAMLPLLPKGSEEYIQFSADIKISIQGVVKQGFNLNHSLCHGTVGNLVILKKALQYMPDAALQSKLDAEIKRLEADISSIADIKCATPLEIHDPGFMIGLSGIGWGYLYLKSTLQLPCLLSLDMPI